MKKLSKKNTHWFILALALIIILIPTAVRIFNYAGNPIGQEAYHSLSMAEEISQDNILHIQTFTPDHYILGYLAKIIPLNIVIYVLPLIIGILSAHFFRLIIKHITKNNLTSNLATIILIISPIFIYLFAFTNSYYLQVFINLLITYLLLTKKSKIITLLLCLLLPLFGISHVLVLLALFITVSLYNKQIRKTLFLPCLTLILSSLFYYIPIYLSYGFIFNNSFAQADLFNSVITDFGALISFSLFFLMMTLLGLFMVNKSDDALPIYLGSLIAAILSYKFPVFRLYINFILVFIVTIALIKIAKRRWKLHHLKNLATLIILCGLLFTTMSYIERISTYEPSIEKINALEWLKEQPEGIVLSHYSNGYFIEYFAEKPAFITQDTSSKDSFQKYLDAEFIFNSYKLPETEAKLKEHNIRYIFISPEMKQGLIWEKQNQGLLLLLEESGKFRKIYSLNEMEVWAYLG